MQNLALKIFIAVALFSSPQLISAQNRGIILTNGVIWTGDAARPFADTVVISGDKILAVGSKVLKDRLLRSDPTGFTVKDLKKAFVMPGINDAHIHFLGGSLAAFKVDLSEATSLAQAQSMIKAFADANPSAPWIVGFGWQYSIFPADRLALRQDLDAVVSGRPVYMTSYDGHSSWANTKAFQVSGIDEKTVFSGFGELVKDKDGRPSGMMKESASSLVGRNVPGVTKERQLEALRSGQKRAAALGITSIQNAHGSLPEVELYDELLNRGELTLRTSFAFSVGPTTTQKDIDTIAETSKRFDSDMLRVRAVKIVVDGVIESYTAAMLDPYSNKPETSGTPNYTQEQLNNVVAMADKAGLQVYIHAIGDRGVRMALDSFENAIRLNGRRDSRFRIEHIETIQASDILRFKKLGVIASMEPIHADPDTVDVWSSNIGPDRTSRGFAWRALQNAGARLVFSSDYPAAISISPWRGLHNAVNRQTIKGTPVGGWYPEQRVTVSSALSAYTSGGAYASYTENVKGKLSAGMYADLIVLDRNPLTVPTSDLYKIEVIETYLGGKKIH